MTPEMQKKMEELLVSDDCGMFSSPERWVGFRRGFKAAHDLMQSEISDLKDKISHYFQRISGDGPELSCPYIDGLIKRYPETASTLERIRTINVQLRYNLSAEIEHKESLKERVKPLVEALKFYADSARYDASDIIDGVEVLEISSDQGDRAREALKGWE